VTRKQSGDYYTLTHETMARQTVSQEYFTLSTTLGLPVTGATCQLIFHSAQ